MLLIGEIARLVGQAFAYAVAQRRIGLLLLLLVAGAVVLLSVSVTTVAPVAIYPFL